MASAWTEHRSPTGRLYWFNAQTGTSSWERPEALKTPAERALASTPWKEYQTAEGRKYWHHTTTKETTWTLPDAVREAIEKAAASAPPPAPPASSQPVSSAPGPPPAPMHPTFVPASTPNPAATPATPAAAPAGTTPTTNLPPRPVTSILHSAPVTNHAPVPMPDFKSPEDAERAFIGLLRLKGVTPSWTWEQTMRDIITEPLYKALDTLAARKAAWEKFIDSERKREKENREKNIARVRASWDAGLDGLSEEKTIVDDQGSEVKLPGAPPRLWWTWDRLKLEVERRAPEVWKLCRDDEERRVLWEDYLTELRQRDTAAANQLRGRQQEKLTSLLRAHQEKLNLPGEFEMIQWRVAQEAILQSEDFQNDEDLRKMDDLDILIVFEEEIKRAEKETMELKAKQKDEKRRSYRKTRAAYIKLLHELKLSGQIHADTMWKEIYPVLKDDERYQNMLGITGSSPLELFWDVIDDLQLELEDKQKVVEDLLEERNKKVGETTEFDEFLTWLPNDMEPHKLDRPMLKQIFHMLVDYAVRTAKEEKRRAEKRLRNQIEDLRYALKKLSPPVKLDTPYEEALERFSHLSEFKSLEGQDEGRKEAFNRYMERLKEKASVEDKRSRRKEEESYRSDSRKKGSLAQLSDNESVNSASKRRRKDPLEDGKYHRHQSPRTNRLHEDISSPRGNGEHREDKELDKDHERSLGRDRDPENDRERDDNPNADQATTGQAPEGDNEKSRSRDRERRRDSEREKTEERSKDRADNRDRPSSRLSADDRDRRRKEYDLDRHGSRRHRSSRRGDRDHDDDSRHRGSRHDEDDGQSREKRSENGLSDKRARSQDRPESRKKSDTVPSDQERDSKRPKTVQPQPEKPAEKSDGEEGELEG
ncbi:uncharacterized protein PGTG_02034 [Puccinia graminis f. sp. tritici CRL 75-36-700-3]|uniref:Pre-mRNA-processing protein prp40 n=1 Tax=Puccinia graminis f. sp. tritici (strain CRL 75-36-700-3 / race SCCL) TaxID=418459 RepID=E3JWZ8_PUCGT|nr:uncharacterized protein PGTG_02034 [Puccinia graminis f. sp. tritici CRL 75-36-700-3]EFP76573.2 hypothetical protein PGTG_02034 [Puccinia graminis f. sp. tritici CRL 75-36-700-3]